MLGSYVDLGNPVADHPLNLGMVGWWLGLPGQLENQIKDLRGGNNAVFTNSPSWTPWKPQFGTVSFNGSTQYAAAPNGGGLNNVQSGSIVLVCRWTSASQSAGYGGYGYATGRQRDGVFSNHVIMLNNADPTSAKAQGGIYNYGPAVTGTTNVGLNRDRHIVVTYRSGAQSLYLDGVLDGTGTATGTVGDHIGTAFTIGGWAPGGNSQMIGLVYETRTYTRELSVDEVSGLYSQWVGGYPDVLRRWNRRSYLFGTAGSSPVTVALTGQSATSTPGTLTPSTAVTLTGLAGTGGTGTLSPTLSPTLTGQYVTAYGPTSIPCPDGQARQYDVGPFTGGTGDYATLTGTVRVNRDTAYDSHTDDPIEWKVGYSGTVGPWTLLFQWVYAGQIGSGTRKIVASATAPGGLLAGYAQDTGLTDCCGTYGTFLEENAGTGTPPGPPDVAPVGLCEGCGDLLPAAAVTQTGQAVTSAAGTVTYSASTALTGLSSTIDTGTLTPETGYVISLTGQSLTTSAGTTTPAVATTLTGDNATGSAGTMVAGVAYTLVGNGVTTAAGAVTATLATTLTGDTATTAVGTLTADLSTALTGSGVTTTTGTLTPALAAAIVGLSTTPAQGTIDPQTGWLIPLTGQSVTVSQGTLGVSITVGITGQSAAVSQGSLTASVHVPFGELYGKWAYPQPKTGRWQYTSPKAGKWAYPDELAGRWTPSV